MTGCPSPTGAGDRGRAVYALVHPTVAHLEHLADNLRASDLEELRALGFERPAPFLWLGAEESELCRVMEYQGRAVAITGVNDNRDGTFAPWLVGTPEAGLHPRAFLAASRRMVDVFRKRYGPLVNYVDARQRASCRYIESLGFTLETPRPVARGMFRRFSMGKLEQETSRDRYSGIPNY